MARGMTVPMLSAPARAEQAAFRALLDCMARPGSIRQLAAHVRPEDGEWCGALLVAQTLVDHEVTFASLAGEPSLDVTIASRTGSRAVALEDADFVVTSGTDAASAFERAHLGPIEEPEESATVIVACALIGTGAVQLELRGPGIAGEVVLTVDGVPEAAFAALARRNVRFPDGIDVVLAARDGAIACLPRSTQVLIKQGQIKR